MSIAKDLNLKSLEMEWEDKLEVFDCILNSLSLEEFDQVKVQTYGLWDYITRSSKGLRILDLEEFDQGVVSLIFNKAVNEPTRCDMYAQLCVDLHKKLPAFPADEPHRKDITFKGLLLNKCQKVFNGADKLRAHYQYLTRINKDHIIRLRTLGNIRFIGELFNKNMVPEKIVHHMIRVLLQFEGVNVSVNENMEELCHFLSTVGKVFDKDPEKETNQTIKVCFIKLEHGLISEKLTSRVRSMIFDVFRLRNNNWAPTRGETRNCRGVREFPDSNPELVKDAISCALEKSPPCIEPTAKFLDQLLSKEVITKPELITVFVSYGSLLADNVFSNNFGEMMAHLVLSGGLDHKAVTGVLKTTEDDNTRKAAYQGFERAVRLKLSKEQFMESWID